MKNFRIFFWVLLIPTAIIADPVKFKRMEEAENCDFILSEPRSGVNWTIWGILCTTQKPHCGCSFHYRRSLIERFQVNVKKRPLVRSHMIRNLQKADPTKNRLILVFRNPKENTIRGCYHFDRELADVYEEKLDKGELFDGQARRLAFYDNWPEESRHLVYYEDMLENPRDTLKGILTFLGESDERLEMFLQNIDKERADCLVLYNYGTRKSKRGGAISKGKSALYHSEKVPKELLLRADELFKTKYSYLWEKYLTRYTENEKY